MLPSRCFSSTQVMSPLARVEIVFLVAGGLLISLLPCHDLGGGLGVAVGVNVSAIYSDSFFFKKSSLEIIFL